MMNLNLNSFQYKAMELFTNWQFISDNKSSTKLLHKAITCKIYAVNLPVSLCFHAIKIFENALEFQNFKFVI